MAAYRLAMSFVLAALTAPAATAADLGHWTIVPTNKSCMAINRPVAEFNAFPANALAFVRPKAGAETELQIWFWPGFVAEAYPDDLFVASTNKNYTLLDVRPLEHAPGKAVSVRLGDGHPAWAALTGGKPVNLGFDGSDSILTFDVAAIPAVIDALADCAAE